jgi:hypothetical protein
MVEFVLVAIIVYVIFEKYADKSLKLKIKNRFKPKKKSRYLSIKRQKTDEYENFY